uniref:Max-binding protein MNT n=1 Tax=Poecilia latipinna TaxID=48699 RepID=A0A3B3URH3_9TELE
PTTDSLISLQKYTAEEDEPFQEKEAIKTEAESKHVELVTSPLPVRANHTAWADEALRQQPHHPPAPPPPSLPPSQVPIAVIPMVPVVNATPSVPPLPLTTPIAAAATSLSSPLPPKKKSTSSTASPLQQQQSVSHHLLCPSQIKMEPAQQLIDVKPSLEQPQMQIQYSASISTNGSGSHHALVPHQAPPTPQSRPNGVTIEDLRGMEGKRRPGGAGTREVHNKLEKNRRAHLKECFETLKKNVPNVDEKKTSNLSVLRSALRYIQFMSQEKLNYENKMFSFWKLLLHTLPANHKHLPIGHITVHPVAHLGAPLGVPVTQPTMVGHITHTFTHHALPHIQAGAQANTNGAQVSSTAVVSQGSPSLGKPTAVLAPHPQLVGQAAVLNPVTMVTVPTFPVSTLKLA